MRSRCGSFPLRERLGDTVVLASFFFRRFTSEFHPPRSRLRLCGTCSDQGCPRPGNLHELEDRVKHAVVIADAGCSRPPISAFPRKASCNRLASSHPARARAGRCSNSLLPGRLQSVESSKAARWPAHALRFDAATPDRPRCVTAICTKGNTMLRVVTALHGDPVHSPPPSPCTYTTAYAKIPPQLQRGRYAAKGNLKAAEIGLATPSAEHRKLRFFIQIGRRVYPSGPAAAEREHCRPRTPIATRRLLSALIDALLRQEKVYGCSWTSSSRRSHSGDRERGWSTALGPRRASARAIGTRPKDLLAERLARSTHPPKNAACAPVDGNEPEEARRVYR